MEWYYIYKVFIIIIIIIITTFCEVWNKVINFLTAIVTPK